MMNTNPVYKDDYDNIKSTIPDLGQLTYVLLSERAVNFRYMVSKVNIQAPNGFFEYNWGEGDFAAEVTGIADGGRINAFTISSRTNPSICNDYGDSLATFGVCPTQGTGSTTPLDSGSYPFCAAFQIEADPGIALEWDNPVDWQYTCDSGFDGYGGYNGINFDSINDGSAITSSIYGDSLCEADPYTPNLCGLSFYFYDESSNTWTMDPNDY